MRPSIPVSFEPGLERGVHWGRDLYTFVTSAAGHMMRTLQKPRRNRPSKRQVNHRRFLHNMIQRKFADIEAANHRLASALYFKEGEEKDKTSLLSSHKPDTPEQSSQSGHLEDPDKCSVHADTNSISKSGSNVSVDLYEASEKKQPDSGYLWKKSQSSRTNNQSKRRQRKESKLVELTSNSTTKDSDFHHGAEFFHTEYCNDEHQLNSINNQSDDTQTPLNDSSLVQFDPSVDISPSFSPELSPLSLDSCDFSIQMFTELSACTPAQRGITDITEGQLTDILDLISVGNRDSEGYMDVEAYFESICDCQGDAGQEVNAADVTYAERSDIFAEVEDLYRDGGEHTYEYGYSCHGDQEQTTNYFLDHQRSAQRQSVYTAQEQFCRTDITQNQPPTSISCHFNTTQLQTYQNQPQKESECMQVTCENNLHFTRFEGVAQSFSAPFHNPEHRPVPTPPQDEDWLFTDIMKDRKSPDYQENKAYLF